MWRQTKKESPSKAFWPQNIQNYLFILKVVSILGNGRVYKSSYHESSNPEGVSVESFSQLGNRFVDDVDAMNVHGGDGNLKLKK